MLLIDCVDLKKQEGYTPGVAEFFQRYRHQAQRFTFHDDATKALAALIRDYPEALLGNFQFALTPYETTYIELNFDLWVKTIDPTGYQPFEERDLRVGYLIHKTFAASLASNVIDGVASSPIGYVMENGAYTLSCPRGFNTMFQSSNQQQFFPFSLGSTFNKANLTDERLHEWEARYIPYIDTKIMEQLHRHDPSIFHRVMRGHAGDLRTLISLLLWIARPSNFMVDTRPANRSWYKPPTGVSRQVSIASHHIIKLRKEVTRHKLLREFRPRYRVRRHEVQGFWRQFNKTECEHDWPIFPDESGHWHCRKCPQWRTRVKQHERGDLAVGIVTKEYEV